jgi:alkanesulfonate monooxygenase SsuD/methylene tetrahydromethanopterin reductase-like flavin-dependent oxidoreductase (luciferase family)
MFLFRVVLGETEVEAKEKYARGIAQQRFIDRQLALISGITDIDFARFPLDEPPPPGLTTNGESASLERFVQYGSGKTLRQLTQDRAADLIGTPDQYAEQMGEIMDAVGGDGFLLNHPFHHINRRYILEVTDGLVPALQRRGLVRTEY